ncbi:MAG: inositol monophosphatase family protein [Acidobacteriota bacterium]
MLEFAISVAKEAGALLRDRLNTNFTISHKGEINLVTEVDIASESLIRERIATRFPRHQVLAEESGLAETSSDYRWVIDPLDGTTNYAHGYPIFCVSIGLEHQGKAIIGVVYDPMREELFSAERGSGAWLNNKKIQVSDIKELSKSLLSTGFPYDIKTSKVTNLEHWTNFAMNAQALRRDGAAALDLCYTACGRFDGFWELNLSAWDMVAGSLIVEEAGGRITNFAGGEFSAYVPEIIASNGLIHEQMMAIIAMKEQ